MDETARRGLTPLLVPTLIGIALLGGALFGHDPEPSRQEIADAYRSKAGEGGASIPGIGWEKWRVKEIRGWSLKFKRTSQKKSVGVLTRQYQVVARKNGQCAEYEVVDTQPFPLTNPQLKPSVTVEPGLVTACR